VQDGRYHIDGTAWGPTPVAAVEVKIDNGPWMETILDDSKLEFA
jgi:hypothetical protein